MRVFATLPQHDLNLVPAAARNIEALGFDGVVSSENRNDPFLSLAVAAASTETLSLATGIAISFIRSPMAAAHASWDLHRASGGRFELGLGSQIKPHNEKRFSVPWGPPAARMREYTQSLQAIWHTWKTGEKLDFKGEHYTFTLMTPNFTPEPCEFAPPKITLAAVGPRMLEVTGQYALSLIHI